MPSGFSSRSSGGSASAGASWNAIGRVKRSVGGHADRRVQRAGGGRVRAAVVHAERHRDAGREAVEDHAAGALAERGHDVGHVLAGLRVHGPGELALDLVERGEQLLARAVAQQQHDRAEVLLEQLADASCDAGAS